MENESEDITNKEPFSSNPSRRASIQKLYTDAGLKLVDKTEESIGKTSLLFVNSRRNEPTDSAEASLRNLNRRKSYTGKAQPPNLKSSQPHMIRNIALANRLREVLLSGHWIANTNYKEQIQSVTWQQAIQKVGELNTLAALVYHVNYYLGGLLDAFKTGKLEIKDKYSFDLPPIQSEDEWNKLVNTFLENSETFANYVESLDDHIFDETFIESKYGTYLRNIEGVIEHCYYHLGQISLIRKMILQNHPNNFSGIISMFRHFFKKMTSK
jgi:hypothetical protein